MKSYLAQLKFVLIHCSVKVCNPILNAIGYTLHRLMDLYELSGNLLNIMEETRCHLQHILIKSRENQMDEIIKISMSNK